jgi:catechol 2,3-dioxygenase-like lactoylglutathione lyase family enzyme
MLVRTYKYRIRFEAINTYAAFQEKVLRQYQSLEAVEILFLSSASDPLLKTEVVQFFGPDALMDIKRIEEDQQVKSMFLTFVNEILDKNYPKIEEESWVSTNLSCASKPHHIEIYCSDLKKSSEFWSWFLGLIGYKTFQQWDSGISLKLGNTYFVFVQAEARYLNQPYHRCHPGLNHLAFYATSNAQIDEVTRLLRDRGTTILYEDRHPHAGGPDTYSVFFEDPERIKVELTMI